MSISPRFLDEVRSRLTVSEIIGQRIKVVRSGRESKACCPFHHEKTPSFTINDEKQFYHCFGCGAHGDIIHFIMQYDNLSFVDAVELLAAQAGLSVPKPTPQEAKKAQKQRDLYALMDEATRFFQGVLQDTRNKEAMAYLLDRGLSRQTIEEFRLGFAPEDGQALRHALRAQDFSDKDMIEAGVLKASTRGGEPYAFFRDRVMFPVPDRRGRVVAFGGRVLPEHLRAPQRGDFTPPKYINSTETPLFHKGSMLYGEPIARRAAADGQRLIVVEGYLDVISCVQGGFRGALAPMGTALTEEQIVSLWKMIPADVKVPILCFDGDNAGRKAAQRVCERILPMLEPACSVDFAFMPEGEDPDSLIKSGGTKALQSVLGQAIPLFDFLWQNHMMGYSTRTPEQRAGVIRLLENEVARIANKEVQVHYRSALRRKISEHFFPKQAFGKGGAPQSPALSSPLRRPAAQGHAIFPKILLAALINHPHIFSGVEEYVGMLRLPTPALEKLQGRVMALLGRDTEMSRDNLLEALEKNGLSKEMSDILNESVYVHASFCSPAAQGNEVESQWLTYFNDGNSAKLGNEIRNGWHRAQQDSSEEEEERLRALVRSTRSESLM